MIRVFETPELMARAAANRVAHAAAAAVEARGRFRIALSGGTTPRRLYEILGGPEYRERVLWARAEVLFADERAVPPDDPESNYRLARECLIGPAAIPAERVRRMRADGPDLDAAAWEYESALEERLDLLVLGIGADGHTASLFPGSPALEESERRVVAVVAPKPPAHRLTVTTRVIREALQVLVLASGEEKAEAVARALEGPPRTVPAAVARGRDWYLDRAAAGALAARVD